MQVVIVAWCIVAYYVFVASEGRSEREDVNMARPTPTLSPTLSPTQPDPQEAIGDAVDEFFLLFPEVVGKKYTITLTPDMTNRVRDPATDADRPAHGTCIIATNEILINKHFATTGGYYQIKKVVFHELGHCVLGMIFHPDNRFEYTIMNQILDTALEDGSNWGYLKGELRLRWLKHRKETKSGHRANRGG